MAFVLAAYAESPENYSITNLMAWVGVDIDTSNATNLPRRASSSPGDAVLGILRSFITNDCEDGFYHMSPARRRRIAGAENWESVPQSYLNEYANAPCDTNLCILSVSNLETNGVEFALVLRLREMTALDSEESSARCLLLFTNDCWKIEGISNVNEL